MRSRYCEAFHARDFLQPVHDVRIVVDYQSVCHFIPLTSSWITVSRIAAGVATVARFRQERLMRPSCGRAGESDASMGPSMSMGRDYLGVSLLAIAVCALGLALDRLRQRERSRLPRQEISRWEEEGGAVPVSSSRTAAQTDTKS
jgi:hypothetical protein